MAFSVSRPASACRLKRTAPLLNLRRQGLTLGVVALSSLLFVLVLPRGPATQLQALVPLVGGLSVGRLGPSVGAIRLGETYGVLACLRGMIPSRRSG